VLSNTHFCNSCGRLSGGRRVKHSGGGIGVVTIAFIGDIESIGASKPRAEWERGLGFKCPGKAFQHAHIVGNRAFGLKQRGVVSDPRSWEACVGRGKADTRRAVAFVAGGINEVATAKRLSPFLLEPTILKILQRMKTTSIHIEADCHFLVTFLSLWKRYPFCFHYSRSS
jgi:hypothetical protein